MIERKAASSKVMSEVQKQKQHPIPPRLEAQLKSKGASLPTQDDYGGAGNAVKGQDERPKTAPLTAFPAPMLSCALFTLDSGRCRHTRDDRGEKDRNARVKNDRNDRVKTIARLVFLARPAHEFPAAIRTNSIHGSCARYTEGTFEGADKGLTHWRECLMTPFAFRFHLECH